jgi:hypothetical protein
MNGFELNQFTQCCMMTWLVHHWSWVKDQLKFAVTDLIKL